MPEMIDLRINGKAVAVPEGSTVASAILRAGERQFRESVGGEPRIPLCGMGVCMECRVTINGKSKCRSCLVLCEAGMEVHTHD
jgi:sarcosine oxidase subunit alpha